MVQAKHLIIIAGLSCAGKSFLIDKIKKGELPALSQQIGIEDASLWRFENAKDLEQINDLQIENLVIHYDFFRQYSPENNKFNYLDDLIEVSEVTTVITLNVLPQILFRRMSLRYAKGYLSIILNPKAIIKYPKHVNKLHKKWVIYKDFNYLDKIKNRWFEYVNTKSVLNHWILDSSTQNIPMATKYTKEISIINI